MAGDELARSVIENVGEHLGRAVAITVNLFNPQKVLIAGEITAAEEILFRPSAAAWSTSRCQASIAACPS